MSGWTVLYSDVSIVQSCLSHDAPAGEDAVFDSADNSRLEGVEEVVDVAVEIGLSVEEDRAQSESAKYFESGEDLEGVEEGDSDIELGDCLGSVALFLESVAISRECQFEFGVDREGERFTPPEVQSEEGEGVGDSVSGGAFDKELVSPFQGNGEREVLSFEEFFDADPFTRFQVDCPFEEDFFSVV